MEAVREGDPLGAEALGARTTRVRDAMHEVGVEALLLSLGADLPWLTGYTAMPLERLTMLVLPADGDATLVVPRLEAPRVTEHPGLFSALVGNRDGRLAISDRAWSTFLLQLQARLPHARWLPASTVTAPIRAVKDSAEIAALRRAAVAADRVATQLVGGEVPLVGRTEAQVSADIGRRLRVEGHDKVNFAIVGSGPNSASPHHDADDRVIQVGESVVCDFGCTMAGYCSDITRTVWTGTAEPPARFRDLYAVLREAQAAAVDGATVGTPCEDVDGIARRIIADGGYGDAFIHRTGHGIGLEEHEDPYLVGGNCTALVAGHAFSVEPGIYLAGEYGARIEDIVVAAGAGPDALNAVSHDLALVDA